MIGSYDEMLRLAMRNRLGQMQMRYAQLGMRPGGAPYPQPRVPPVPALPGARVGVWPQPQPAYPAGQRYR